jgi:protein disulfide-isomerase
MRIPLLLSSLLFSGAVLAATLPYDEKADAKVAVQHALADAKAAHVPVLVIFGANWCEDCRALDKTLHSGKNAELMSKKFRVVKVDVGNFDHNTDLTAAYGNPTKKGIPAAVLLSADNKVLYATKGGELANARRMSESGVYDFFENVTQSSQSAQATTTATH